LLHQIIALLVNEGFAGVLIQALPLDLPPHLCQIQLVELGVRVKIQEIEDGDSVGSSQMPRVLHGVDLIAFHLVSSPEVLFPEWENFEGVGVEDFILGQL
jgi:hypothetical protein